VIECHDPAASQHLIGEFRGVLKDNFGDSSDVIADVVRLLEQDAIAAEALPLSDLPLKDPKERVQPETARSGLRRP